MDALGATFKMPTLEDFCERLTWEGMNLSTLESSTYLSKALVASNQEGKGKIKPKPKQNSSPKQSSPKPQESKSKESSKKKDKSPIICAYCGKNGHEITKCRNKLQDLENATRLGNLLSLLHGVYHHMTSSKESFVSLCLSFTASIEMRDSSFISAKGKVDIVIDGGHINDVLYMPNISTNLLSVYQICNSQKGKTTLFTSRS